MGMRTLLRFAGLVTLGCMALFSGAAFAQDATADNSAKTRISGWNSQCVSQGRQDALVCNVEQAIYLADSGQQLAKVSARIPGDGKAPEMVIHLPHGIYLPGGLALQIDEGSPKTHPIHTCDATACYVILDDVTGLVASMKAGANVKLAFLNLGRDEITVTIPLDGFTATYTKAE